jgi:DNA polymerase-4
MDAFYVSVEERDNPHLVNKPVAVGGKVATRSVLSTCNYIAREYGVRSAMPIAVALRKCPSLIIVPGRMQVYQDISLHLNEIFSRYTTIIEPLSLDEAFLDVTDCKLFQGSATLIAHDIRRTIFNELKLTASAGISSIKYLAKVASDLNKPNGQFVISPDNIDSFIDNMPLKKIPGVGKVTVEKLNASGLIYGRDVKNQTQEQLIEYFGKLGHILWTKCQGIDNRSVETVRNRKSVGVEHTFSKDIADKLEMSAYLLDQLIPELKRRSLKYLHKNQVIKLGVKVKFKDFQQTTKEFSYTDFNNDIFLQLFNEALNRGKGKPVRLLGVHIAIKQKVDRLQQLALSWS